MKLVEGVLALLGTERGSPQYFESVQGVLAQCEVALTASMALRAAARETAVAPVAVPVRADLGPRSAELAANGKGVRAVARILGVNASIVSRRLRRADLG